MSKFNLDADFVECQKFIQMAPVDLSHASSVVPIFFHQCDCILAGMFPFGVEGDHKCSYFEICGIFFQNFPPEIES